MFQEKWASKVIHVVAAPINLHQPLVTCHNDLPYPNILLQCLAIPFNLSTPEASSVLVSHYDEQGFECQFTQTQTRYELSVQLVLRVYEAPRPVRALETTI
eukprot:jgi/Botrbrau1/20061/Bobra.200_1s0065.1